MCIGLKIPIFSVEGHVSKICSPWVSGERDNISDVLDSRSKENHPFKAKAEPAMLHCPIPSKVEIPLVWLQWKIQVQYPEIKTVSIIVRVMIGL